LPFLSDFTISALQQGLVSLITLNHAGF